MLARNHRLSRERDIRRLLRLGKSYRGASLRIRFLFDRQGDARFTVVVSTKVSKKATIRNRLKRWAREMIRSRIRAFPPGDYLLIVQPGRKHTRNDLLGDVNDFSSRMPQPRA